MQRLDIEAIPIVTPESLDLGFLRLPFAFLGVCK
jgi:hypothetical protein